MSDVESLGIAKAQEATRAINQMVPLVLEVVRSHPGGITAREITEELGFTVDEGQDSLPDLSKHWVVSGVLDKLAIRRPGQKREPPLEKKHFSAEALYSLK